MLDRNLLIKNLIAAFEKKKPTPSELQEERRRLHAMPLYDLGRHYKSVFPKQDPYELKAA